MATTNTWDDMQLDPYQKATASTAKATTVMPMEGYDATTGQAATGTAANVGTMTGYNSLTGNASQGILTRWDVNSDQLVENRMNNMLAHGSAYRDQAETAAKQSSAKRGLLNSSMAATAGYDAAIRSALPIAQQDAQTMASSGQFNASSANDMSKYNATNTQQMTMANMDAVNAERAYLAEALNKGTLTQSEYNQRINELNAQQNQQMNIANMDAANAASQFNVQQTNTGTLKQADLTQQNEQFNAQQKNAIAEANAARDFDAQTAQLQANIEQFKTVTDQATQIAVADIEAQYNVLMQASASAADLYQQMLTNITNISMNEKMSEEAKQVAIQNQITMLDTGLATLGLINDLELDDLLVFDTNPSGGIQEPTPPAEPGTEPTPKADYTYEYDKNGNPTGIWYQGTLYPI